MKAIAIPFAAVLAIALAACSSPTNPSGDSPSSDKAITSFSFDSLSVAGTVSESDHTVSASVSFGTDRTSLVPTIEFTGASISPASGADQDFSSPVTYTVTAEDGTTQEYVVTVTRKTLSIGTTNPVIITPVIHLPGLTGLDAPENLKATASGTTINLSWDAVDGDDVVYVVYYNTTGSPTEDDSAWLDSDMTNTSSSMTDCRGGTKYYFVVAAYTSDDSSDPSSVASATTGVVVGGKGPAGGWVFYDSGAYVDGWRYLECAQSDQVSCIWGPNTSTTISTSSAIGTGQSNSANIMNAYGTASGTIYAARICDALVSGGESDWFLPSYEELNLAYTNLYLEGKGSFVDGEDYWTSTMNKANSVKTIYFSSTFYEFAIAPTNSNNLRAIRRF